MNVCNIPMQAAAYNNPQLQQTHAAFFKTLETVRTANNKDTYQDLQPAALQDILVTSLRKKLHVLAETHSAAPLHLIPCGKFAQKFFRLANVHYPNWTLIDGVPHPSYNSWDRQQYAPAIHRLTTAFHHSQQEN